MAKKTQKYYVVWAGHQPGIYDSWDGCQKQTKGFPGAQFKSFPSRGEAEKAFQASYQDYKGQKSSGPSHAFRDLSPKQKEKVGQPIMNSLSVDAACSGVPGPVEYRGVYTKTGQEIFRLGPFEDGTNNIGEFLALVHGLALLTQKGSNIPVYSDSRTAMSWVRKKKCNTQHSLSSRNKQLFDMVHRAEKWLQSHTWTNEILKWETPYWGEIPADFGRK